MIPTPDEIAMPAPAAVFKILLVLTFLLHVIPMNVVLGGNIVVLTGLFRGREGSNLRRMAHDLAKILPVFVSWAVTFGVAPLLFLQVLYGQAFYTSSILIGWYWLSVIGLIIVAYYFAYILRNKWDRLGKRAPLLSLIICALFCFVAFLWTTNVTLHMLPEVWKDHYLANPFGSSLFTGDAQITPRLLHFVIGALAVTGMAIAVVGWRKSRHDADYGQYLIKAGSRIFLAATVVQIGIGLWFLFSLPDAMMEIFLGGDSVATIMFMGGATAGAGALAAFGRAAVKGRMRSVWAGIAMAVVTLAGMLVMRQILREAYLEGPGHIQPEQMEVSPQWGAIIMFTVCFVWGIYAVGKLLLTALREAKQAEVESKDGAST